MLLIFHSIITICHGIWLMYCFFQTIFWVDYFSLFHLHLWLYLWMFFVIFGTFHSISILFFDKIINTYFKSMGKVRTEMIKNSLCDVKKRQKLAFMITHCRIGHLLVCFSHQNININAQWCWGLFKLVISYLEQNWYRHNEAV